MLKKFFCIRGNNGTSPTMSGELALLDLLAIQGRQSLADSGGLDIDAQEGINRPLEQKRPEAIADVFESYLANNQPIENGAVLLVILGDEYAEYDLVDKGTGLTSVLVKQELPAIDRQHTSEAYRLAYNNPTRWPKLHAYVCDRTNTITVKLIVATRQEALRRFLHVNTGQKKPSPVEMFTAMTLDAKQAENDGTSRHEKYRPGIVAFEFCYRASKDPQHPLYGHLPVQVGEKNDPIKSKTNMTKFISALWPLHSILESLDRNYKNLSIENQAERMKELSLPYWQKVKELMGDAFSSDGWHKYNVLRAGAPLLVENFNALLRLYREFVSTKTTKALLSEIKGTSIEYFCSTLVPKFLDATDASTPYKSVNFWALQGGSFRTKYDAEGEEVTSQYVWGSMKPKGVSQDDWNSYLRTIQTHASKVRYNERKPPTKSSEVLARRKKKKEQRQDVDWTDDTYCPTLDDED